MRCDENGLSRMGRREHNADRGDISVITYVVGSLFQSPAQVLVNTVNTVGVMGKGIAKEFKRIYPDMFRQYQALCEARRFSVGQLWLYKTPHKWILNFPTKQHWRQPSRVEYIEVGLQKFVDTYSARGITSVAFPALGCGNGELNWDSQVRPVMERYLNKLPVDVFVYLRGTDESRPEHHVPDEITAWLRGEPASLPFSEVQADLASVLQRKTQFELPGGTTRFSCSPITDSFGEFGVRIDDGSTVHTVENWQLLDLWQHIRSFGYCMDYTIPSGLEPLTPYLVSVFAELSYLKPVLVSRSYRGLTKDSVGLQLTTPVRSATTDLRRRTVSPVLSQKA